MAKLCPECDNPLMIDVDEVDEGETTATAVVSLEPLEIAPVDSEVYDDEETSRDEEDDEDA